MKLRVATPADHDEIVKVAKTSKYTRDFSNRVMFSSDAAYEKGWIRVAEEDGKIVGFTCVRHKVRDPKTMLYFVTVLPEYRRKGVAFLLLEETMHASPHTTMELNVMKDNEAAISFYNRHGFRIAGEAMGGEAHRLEREFPKE